MAKEVGTNVLLYVALVGSPSGSFTVLAGQQSTEFVGDTTTDDITDKAQQGWQSTMNVLHGGTVNVRGKADWPDTNALDVLRQAWLDRTSVECKLVLNSAGAHFSGYFFVTQFNVSGTHQNATEYSITLRNNGALDYAAS